MEGLNKENKIEIRPVGSYFEVDEEGYLKNPASAEKIQEKWKPLIGDIVEAYKKQFGDKLLNVYIRGSVAKGEAVEGISDVDTFAYVDLSKEEIKKDWVKTAEIELRTKYPFANGIELGGFPPSDIEDDGALLNQSLCVFGEPLEVPKTKKPGRESTSMRHLPNINKRMDWFEKKIEKIDSDDKEELKSACVWLMKEMLRCGFELTMERSGRYTRDLYLCYKDFSEYYPDKEALMREILDLALNPTSDKDKIKEVKDQILPWMVEESKRFI